MQLIYKILTSAEWRSFQKEEIFSGSAVDLKDGFIHCSFEDQYPGVMERYFTGIRPLVLLTIDPGHLPEGSLKVEASTKGMKFPHIYGTIPINAVISSRFL